MNINETESDTSQENTGGAEVVASSAPCPNVDIPRQGDTEHVGKCLGTLDVAPSSTKVASSHFLIHVHLECVIVSANKNTIHPDKCHVSVVALRNNVVIML